MGNRKFPASSCAVLLLSCVTVLFILFHWQPHLAAFPASAAPAATMTLVHTVLFQFKADANPEEVKAAVARFIDLKEQCIHPTSSKPYILSLKGGQDNSPEGLQVLESKDQRDAGLTDVALQNGVTHGFVAEFSTAEDRDYYVDTDPAHQKFKESIGGLIDKAIVVDFTNGIY